MSKLTKPQTFMYGFECGALGASKFYTDRLRESVKHTKAFDEGLKTGKKVRDEAGKYARAKYGGKLEKISKS